MYVCSMYVVCMYKCIIYLVGNMPSVHHSTIRGFSLLSGAIGSVRRTFLGTLLPRSTLTFARPTSRLKWLGWVERDVRASWERSFGPPHLAHFVSSPIFSGPPPRLGRSERPDFRVPPLSRPPEPLFTNHNKGVVPTIYLLNCT